MSEVSKPLPELSKVLTFERSFRTGARNQTASKPRPEKDGVISSVIHGVLNDRHRQSVFDAFEAFPGSFRREFKNIFGLLGRNLFTHDLAIRNSTKLQWDFGTRANLGIVSIFLFFWERIITIPRRRKRPGIAKGDFGFSWSIPRRTSSHLHGDWTFHLWPQCESISW